MKTKELGNTTKIILITVIILLIMAMSFGFRYMVNRKVVTNLGEDYIDEETGVPYLTEMDSYYHLRMTRDLELYGHAGDTIKDGEPWDSLSYAPDGRPASDYRPLMANIAILAHRFLSMFGNVTLEQVAYWQGAVISAFVVIPVFIFVYRLKGMLAAVTASVLATVNYGYFVHTVPGFYDTDMVISWTSCCVFCFGSLFISTISPDGKDDKKDGKQTWIKRIAYAALFILSLILLFGSWYVYYMFAGIIAAAGLIYALLKCLTVKGESRKGTVRSLLPVIAFVLVLGIGILIAEPGILQGAWAVLRGVFTSGAKDLFPNALVSVSEMRKPSLIAGGFSGLFQMRVLSGTNIGVINAIGGLIPTLAAIAMCILLIIKIVKKEIRFEYVLLIIWFAITAVLAVRSWRFIMLFAVPVAILAGMLTGTLYELMRTNKMMDYKIFAGMIAVLMLFPAIYGAYRSSADSMPSVNRYLHKSLSYIRDNTDEDAIVTGWWDYGYFFEEKTERRTLFDGGSQNGARIYWVARAFATSDEELASNIFCMLAGSGNAAVERMLEVFGEDKSTLALMDELLRSGKEGARARLDKENIGNDTAEELTGLLYPETNEDLLCIITQEMPGITGWFSRFGYPDGEDGYGDDGYSVIMDRQEIKGGSYPAVWRMIKNGQPVDIYVDNTDGLFNVRTEYGGEDGSPRPCHIEKVLVIRDGMLSEHESGDAGIEEGLACTAVINADLPTPRVSIVTSLLEQSVFGQLYYEAGSGLDNFSYTGSGDGSAMVFKIE